MATLLRSERQVILHVSAADIPRGRLRLRRGSRARDASPLATPPAI